jgi:hypothetical protein
VAIDEENARRRRAALAGRSSAASARLAGWSYPDAVTETHAGAAMNVTLK